ncbi:MAG TPA: hypothetical protein PK926_06975 [Spirochaetota bacterium]|nr:hypothetical protein [Spirochaetota bacterium]HPI90879.1 hypothetical protein [Spirochaetota bacterium]HPR48111.1 hypothetical protein [Spirochaetota bacterium]
MHINIGFAYGFPFGGLIDKENESYSLYSEYEEIYIRPTHYDISVSFFIDLAPFDPIVLGNEAHAIKIGVRGGYRIHKIKQNLTIKPSKNKEDDYGGMLLDYQRWMVGPVLHYAPVIHPLGLGGGYSAQGGLTFFLLFGQLVNAELTAYPAWRKKEGSSAVGPYKSDVHGFAIDIGFGGEISIGTVNLGLNLYYTYLEVQHRRSVYPSLGSTSSFHEISVELYFGIPIEWW